MAGKMSFHDRMARKRARQAEGMVRTVLRLMRDENFANNLSVDYEIADKAWRPIIETKVQECLASGMPHIRIPQAVLKAL